LHRRIVTKIRPTHHTVPNFLKFTSSVFRLLFVQP